MDFIREMEHQLEPRLVDDVAQLVLLYARPFLAECLLCQNSCIYIGEMCNTFEKHISPVELMELDALMETFLAGYSTCADSYLRVIRPPQHTRVRLPQQRVYANELPMMLDSVNIMMKTLFGQRKRQQEHFNTRLDRLKYLPWKRISMVCAWLWKHSIIHASEECIILDVSPRKWCSVHGIFQLVTICGGISHTQTRHVEKFCASIHRGESTSPECLAFEDLRPPWEEGNY